MNEAASIGIIGGADGPTAIIVTGSPADWILAAAVLAVVITAAVLRIRHCRKRKK